MHHLHRNTGRFVIGGLACHNEDRTAQVHEVFRQLRQQLACRYELGEEILRQNRDVHAGEGDGLGPLLQVICNIYLQLR